MNLLELKEKVTQHLVAGYPGLFIQSGEESRVDALVSDVAAGLQLHPKEWNLGYGWVDFFNKQPRDGQGQSTELAQSLPALLDDDLDGKLIVIKDARSALENQPLATARLKQLLNRIQRHHRAKAAVILVSETLHIPPSIEAQITLLPLVLPRGEEITAQIDATCEALELHVPDVFRQRLSAACGGLSQEEIRSALAMVRQQCERVDEAALPLIQREKEQTIAKSGVLEMIKVSEHAGDIGGLENLKQWLGRRAQIFRRLDNATQAGISAPKGVLIAGMPGCGKSLTAKAAAGLFQLPLLRLDIGSLLGKYVGESEHNMRRALTMAESVSPCILWIDELEKAFVGMSGNGSEVSSRLFGYFLTWMQEKTGAVFVIATANKINALPPELLRKGRFDEVFYVGFPNAVERGAILDIHLSKDGLELTHEQRNALVAQCRDYAGADMQNAINEAREAAFLDSESAVKFEHVESAIQRTVPLRETLREQVNEYEELFEKFKLKPASASDGLSVAQMIKMAEDPNAMRRRVVALDPDCPDDLLERLANDEEFDIRKAVYQNPNCPERLLTRRINIQEKKDGFDLELLHLACVHPHAPHDLLASQFNRLSLTTEQKRLLATRSDHEALHEHLLDDADPAVLGNLARNQSLSSITQKRLAAHTQWEIREHLAANESLHPDAQELLARDGHYQVRETLARLNSLTEAVQLALTKDDDIDVRIQLALRSHSELLPETVQRELARNDVEVRRTLAENESLGVEIQQMLAQDPNENVRRRLARHANLASSVMQLLAVDTESVQEELARNGHLGALLQTKLSVNNSEDVRAALAANAQLLIEVQHSLARDSSAEVRRQLASNDGIAEEILEVLMRDGDEMVRDSLLRQRSTVPEGVQRHLARDASADVRAQLARSDSLVADVQHALGTDLPQIRQALASNSTISIKTQHQLLSRGDLEIRRRLAGNPGLDAPLQARLAEDDDTETRRALAQNPALAMLVADKLIGDSEDIQTELARNRSLTEAQYARLHKHGSTQVRVRLAGNSSVGNALLIELANEPPGSAAAVPIRLALARNYELPSPVQDVVLNLTNLSNEFLLEMAGNPSLSEVAQEQLAKDDNIRVREALAANINLSAKVTRRLLDDNAVLVRSGLIQQDRWLTADVERRLAEDESSSVRLTLASRDGLRKSTQLMLANDTDAKVRARLVERDSPIFRGIGRIAQEILARDNDTKVRHALASYGGLVPSVQLLLATDASAGIRQRLAKGDRGLLFARLNEEAQLILAKDNDLDVRLELAEHPGLTPRTQCQLAADSDTRVKLRLLQATNFLNPLSVPAQLLLSRDPDREVRFALVDTLYGTFQMPSSDEVTRALVKDQDVQARIFSNMRQFRTWEKASETLKSLMLEGVPDELRESFVAAMCSRKESQG
ncbi:AAA family ATPase [Achromobacter spanius]|uniref:AAA family ATPase n=1 Tax=Achromobacter spanius TaxID=217203 RepID=UPI00320B0398